MVQLKVLSGQKAGKVLQAAAFPVRIGRASTADLQLEEPGVWDQHLELEFQPAQGFLLARKGEALATINGEAFDRRALRNGDLIEIGALKLRFWLAETKQKGLRWREGLVWGMMILFSLLEIAVIHALLR